MKFDELKNAISIMELATANGYALDKIAGYKWPLLRHANGDKIIIVDARKSTQGYFNPQDDRDKGSVIDFVKNRLGDIFQRDATKNEFENVSDILHAYLRLPLETRKEWVAPVTYVKEKIQAQQDVVFKTNGLQPLSDLSYLQSRYLSKETLDCDLFKARIFNHPAPAFKNNIGFIYTDKDDGITGVELRNTNMKLFLPGSDRSACVWHSNIPANLESVLFFESPIDALSYYALNRNGSALYIAFGGQLAEGQLQTAKFIIEKSAYTNAVLKFCCFDNDKAGERFTEKLKEYFALDGWLKPDVGKDFNEMLEMREAKMVGRKMKL